MIIVVRHGETALNAARVIQRPDTPLSARGLAQAERLGRRLAGRAVGGIVTSHLARAVMTAERVRAHVPAPLAVEPVLEERNFGDLRGTPYAELPSDIYAADFEPPNGESWPAFHARVARAWERVVARAAETEGDLVVVTHGLVCHVLAARHLALPADLTPPARWANTSVTVIERTRPWRAQVVNCTAHLDGATSDDGAAPSGL